MGVQITLFTKNYVRKYLLPPLSNGDYSLLLEKEAMGLSRTYVLHLEVLRGIWRIHPGTDYEVVLESRFLKKPEELKTDGFFGIRLKEGVELSAGVRKVERVIRSFRKLRLTEEKEILIGRREECDILCREQKQISGVHGVMRWAGGIWYIRCYSDNGIYINGKLSGGEHSLTFGDRIQIAELTLVFLGRVLAVDTSAGTVEFRLPEWKERNQKKERTSILPEKKKSGRGLSGPEADPSLYHRAPRKIPAVKFTPVEIEEPPREAVQETRPLWLMVGPPLTMALPMILGFGLMRMAFGGRSGGYLYAGLLMSVTAALGSVFWAVMNQRRASKKSREKETHRKKAYLAYLLRKKTELKEIAEDFRKYRQNLYPPPEECFRLRERQELWERTPMHSDFMKYRLGIGEVSFPIEIKIPKERFLLDMDELTEHPGRIKKELSVLSEVPILCDLSGESMVGMVSDRSPDSSAELGTLIGAQIGALNCYTEVKIAVVFNETRGEQAKYWEFAKWLPHIWSEDHKVRYYAANREEGAEVLAQLSQVLRERTALQKENSSLRFLPHIILFISEEEMKEHRDFQHLFQQETGKLGFAVCVMAQSVQRLPHICHRIIEKTSSCSGIYCTDGSERTEGKVEFDRVTPADLERFARSISGIRVSEQTEKGEIPSKITFLKLHQVTSPEELHAEERWLKNRTYDNIRGELGIMSGGNRLCLDLHEKYHGPHGLLAGTTGSGKSETLLTFLLSLAVNYSPEELNYFLIDYKGGGMASMMEGLPHLAGSISNLSGNHIYRALVSIKSENQKRQRMFLEYEVNHIDAYLRLYQNGEAKEAIPHLLIVVDEFAELKKAEPEFMRELISVAQVGRSLGVHLILATQKPAGVVDDHIRSNAHFRICLRVQDRQDSTDLLHKPDAANLTQIGRGYLQVGNDEIYEEFQSGYSGASYDPENKRDAGESVVLLSNTGHGSSAARQRRNLSGESELQAVKEYLGRVFEGMGMRRCASLWMEELPEILYLSDCGTSIRQNSGISVLLGKMDDPERQMQPSFEITFPECGHLVILGMTRSGKSTLLQTLLTGILFRYSPEDIQILAFDFSDGGMTAFASMPHTIGILKEQEDEHIPRALHQLEKMLEERKKERTVENLSEKCEKTRPLLLVILDNYSKFREKTGDLYEHILYRIAREGAALGMLLVITGVGFSMGDIPTRFSNMFQTVLCLALPDKFAYRDALRSMKIDRIPEPGIPGRGLAVREQRILEFQTALAVAEEDALYRRKVLREQCESYVGSYQGKRAALLPRIPAEPKWKEFNQDTGKGSMWYIPVGYEDATGDLCMLDFRKEYCMLIAGERRSGRKNYLKVLLLQMRKRGGTCCIIDCGGTFFAGREREYGIKYLQEEEELFEWFQKNLIPLFMERKEQREKLIRQGLSEEKIREALWKEPPCFVGIADFPAFLHLVYHAKKDMKGFLENIFEKGEGLHIYFAAVIANEQKEEVSGLGSWKKFVRQGRGIQFGGALQKNPALCFQDISYSGQTKLMEPGWGMLPQTQTEKQSRKIRVPLVEWEDL